MFCSSCGTRIDDPSVRFCPSCGFQLSGEAPPGSSGRKAPSFAGADQFITPSLSILRKFFSKEPLDSVDESLNSGYQVAISFGTIFVLVSAIAPLTLISQYVSSQTRGLGFSASDLGIPYLKLFAIGIILGAVVYGVIGLIVWLLHKIYRHDVPFTAVLNVTAVALLPSTLALIASIILGFISLYLSAFLIAAGFFLSVIFFYHGVQAIAPFDKQTFFVFSLTAAYLVFTVVDYFLITKFYSGMLENFL
jgi:hypothetical protein